MLPISTPAALLAFMPLLPQGGTADYQVLTNTRRSVANFNVETVRGLAYDAPLDRLYAVNTHGSALMAFDATPPPGLAAPILEWRTLNNPSALALWDDATGGKFAIVVGGGTHGVVKQDRTNGDIVAYLDLPSEPMDIVLDTERNLAFVSCAGPFDDPSLPTQPTLGGMVKQIDLATFTFSGGTPAGSGQHWIGAVRPTFLSIELGGAGTSDNFVYVAPFLSANRTTFEVDSWGDSTVASAPGLPDDDLYRIDHLGAVASVYNGAGTLLTAHGRNPATQQYWIANVELLNAAQHTEPDHRGRFAENRITRITAPPSGAFSFAGTTPLDGATPPSTPPSANNKPGSFPFGLAFDAAGNAFVTGSTSDVLRVLDSSGATTRSVALPAGSIPRSLLLPTGGSTLFVYLWGTNRVVAFDAAALVSATTAVIPPVAEFDLGADPLPEAAKHGRAIWYDADNSNDAFATPAPVPGKVSCNTCHPRGGMDGLGWDLRGPPLDRKDTMVTQSLLSIEDTFPYHWRGERSLSEFNGAFHDLLGGQVLSANDLADFEAFVFSLQAPANPRQNKDRVLDDSQHVVRFAGVTGSAIQGQQIFLGTPNALAPFFPSSCSDCHGAETGSNGLITSDVISGIPSNTHADVPHLRQLQHKFSQPTATASASLGLRPRSGFGFTQDGDDKDIIEFLNPAVFFIAAGSVPAQDALRTHVASFVVQFDQGIAPRAHGAVPFTMANMAEVTKLIDEAKKGWIDLVAIGHFLSGGVPTQPFGLWYDADTQLFHTAEPGVGFSFTLSNLQSLLPNGVRLLFLGVPPGNGFRFAVDPDDDEMSNTAEIFFTIANPSTPISLRRRDSDGDTFPDGYEVDNPPLNPGVFNASASSDTTSPGLDPLQPDVVDFVSGRVSKHFVAFTELVTYDVQALRFDGTGYQPFGPVQHHRALRSFDTLLAHGLVPRIDAYGVLTRNEEFRLEVTLKDVAGNTKTVTIPSLDAPPLQTDPAVEIQLPLVPQLVVSDLSASQTGGVITVDVEIDDIWEGSTPPFSVANDKTAVLQLVAETAPGSGEFAVPTGVVLTPTFPSRVDTTVTIQASIVPAVTLGGTGSQILGPFLFSAPSDGQGAAQLVFTQSGLPAGTKVRLVLLGIFELLDITPATATGFSNRFWQLPMTETADRSVEFTL